ncbi:MAG TPA: twin transmembrane helix small protein [Porticoccaceae bacterium]|nr:twin transmembrane helix small protein [Porticoccaceae bacterium]
MLLKVIIVLLFIGVVVSLSSALVFLMKDVGNPRKRTMYALAVRVSLATALIATILYGFYTGQLSSKAPWDKKLHPGTTTSAPLPGTPDDPIR